MQTKAASPAVQPPMVPNRTGFQTRLDVTQRPSLDSGATGLLQRKCACGGSGPEGECEECKKGGTVQRRATGPAGPARAPSVVHEVLRSPSQRLDPLTRAYLEPRLGHDFSKVHIHADVRAAQSADAVNALAYTVGHHIVFGAGQYAPQTAAGKKLIAHELAHVIQQSGQQDVQSQLVVASAHDAFEHEADRVAQRALSGRPSQLVTGRHVPAVQRQLPPTSPGPPTMQGPDWGVTCDFSKFPPKCSANTPAGDAPLEKDQYRCYLLAREGRCPPDCEDTLRPLGVPCVRAEQPRSPNLPPTGGPILPQCPPGQIPYSGRCIPFRPTPQSASPPPTGGTTSTQCPPDQIPTITGGCSPARVPPTTVPPGPTTEGPTAPHARFGTIESETLDNFALNDPHVPEQYAAQLDHLAGLLNVYREVEVHIEGHTDGSGTEGINVPLSQQRAEAVKAKLIARHVVNPARLKTQGFSSHQPQVPPSTPTAQEPRNRRVEIWYHIAPSQLPGEGLRMRTNL